MTIPDYQTIMLPMLRLLGDKREHSLRETIDNLASEFRLTPEEKHQLLSSGKQPLFDNRVGWSRTYLKKAGLIESTRRGCFRITERGLEILNRNLNRIDSTVLEEFEEFREFVAKRPRAAPTTAQTPRGKQEIPITHDQIRDMLYDIGQIEGKVCEREYRIDGERIDVAWKRIEAGNPYAVFEVQIGGNFYEALAKLKHAWDKWNSRPFLVTTDQYKGKALEWVRGSFHEMQKELRIIDCQKVRELHEAIGKSKSLKEELGIA